MLGAVSPDSFDTLHSYANTFQMPFVTPWFPEKVLAPSSGSLDHAISMRPDYHKAIIDVIRYYGWGKIIYLYDSHDGESVFCVCHFPFLSSPEQRHTTPLISLSVGYGIFWRNPPVFYEAKFHDALSICHFAFIGLLRLQQIYQGLQPGNDSIQVESVKRLQNVSDAITFLHTIEELSRYMMCNLLTLPNPLFL
jgi:Receptor family ligand binding region